MYVLSYKDLRNKFKTESVVKGPFGELWEHILECVSCNFGATNNRCSVLNILYNVVLVIDLSFFLNIFVVLYYVILYDNF